MFSLHSPSRIWLMLALVIASIGTLAKGQTISGTIVGTVLIVLLQSLLSVMAMPEAGRQIIYGMVIIAMLIVYRQGVAARG